MKRRKHALSLSGVISVSEHVMKIHDESEIFSPSCDRRIIHNANVPQNSIEYNFDPSQKIRIGFIGYGSKYKGLPVLVRAFDRMKYLNSKLVIAGKIDEDVSSVITVASRNQDITLLGFCEARTFYEQVDVVVVPSIREEPFGLVVIEAKANGLPVIASDIGGIPEALGGSDCGWLTAPGDFLALSRLLDSVSRQPDQLRIKGRAAFDSVQKWTFEDFGRAYEAAYLSAVDRSQAKPLGK